MRTDDLKTLSRELMLVAEVEFDSKARKNLWRAYVFATIGAGPPYPTEGHGTTPDKALRAAFAELLHEGEEALSVYYPDALLALQRLTRGKS